MNYHAVKAFILDKLERELSDRLTYHGLHHTIDVLYTTEELCYSERIPPYEAMLLKTAALFHDSGFTISNKEHETLGCQLAAQYLPAYDYTLAEVHKICGMIMATKIPQTPRNFLEQILCDADLDYLGRDDFYTIGATLYEELKAYNILETEEAWNRLQVNFLEKHTFFTRTNLRRRTPRKQRYLEELKKIVADYKKSER
ncbi:MAG: HD domain-containing protein [Saprospiraceae bacterium]|nr:HD domain-containing protein [Saprospiraceae bacterium]